MWFKPAGTDWAVESRARDQARWLIRDHQDQAEAVLAAKLKRPDITAVDRYRYQLTAKELKRLRRAERSGREVTVWQPRSFSAANLLSLFGVRAIDRRKKPRG